MPHFVTPNPVLSGLPSLLSKRLPVARVSMQRQPTMGSKLRTELDQGLSLDLRQGRSQIGFVRRCN